MVLAAERAGVLRRPRPQGADRAPQRPRRRPRLFPAHHDDLQRHDAADRHPAAAGDRRGARRRRPRPAASWSRAAISRSPRRKARLRHARRRYRPVLLDADGGAVAQRRAQARDGDAAHRRHHLGREGRSASASSTRSCRHGQERAKAHRARAARSPSKSSHVIGIGKEAFYRQLELPLADAYRYAAEVMTENMMARDAEEGICAFIEKRDPTGKTSRQDK